MLYAVYPACGCPVLNHCSAHGFNCRKIIFQSIGDTLQKFDTCVDLWYVTDRERVKVKIKLYILKTATEKNIWRTLYLKTVPGVLDLHL